MFDRVVIVLIEMLESHKQTIIKHLSAGRTNRVALRIKIQSPQDVSLEVETLSKNKLSLNKDCVEDNPLYSSKNSTGFAQKERTPLSVLFDEARYQSEIDLLIRHYLTICSFYSLPLEITFYIKSDNSITGNIVANFVFNKSKSSLNSRTSLSADSIK